MEINNCKQIDTTLSFAKNVEHKSRENARHVSTITSCITGVNTKLGFIKFFYYLLIDYPPAIQKPICFVVIFNHTVLLLRALQ